MSRVRLAHCNAAEAEARAQALRSAGHHVFFGKEPCDVLLVDLSRLPSQGREVAIAFRGAKATRHLPIVFVEGALEKVAAIRQQLPDAIYTTWPAVEPALQRARPLPNPVVPPQMMERYAGRSTAQKLGIREGSAVAVIHAPRDYARVLGELPPGARIEEESHAAPVTLCFVRTPSDLPPILELGRKLSAMTKFWICWPKGKISPIRENYIRDSAIALGLVDYKVCSVDATWSGLLFR